MKVEIKSNKTLVNKPISEVYDYLIVPANYEVLMPSKVRSFSASDTSAILDIEGIGNVELAITETVAPTKIVMLPQNKVPFKFDIQWELQENQSGDTIAQATINAELNLMMKMMAEKMLANFLNVQVEKLAERLIA